MGTTHTGEVQTGTAVALNDDRKETGIRLILSDDRARQAIEPFLMPGMDYNRVVAAAHYAARQMPAIQQCTPTSIIDAVCRILQWNLDIGTTAHLVPFGKVCTPIADYKGIAELMVRSGAVRHVEARVVYERDEFSYTLGTSAEIRHRPSSGKDDQGRGAITHAYVVLHLPFNRMAFEVMPAEDIEAIRQKYSKQWKAGPLPAWYAKKCVVRQAAKLIPKDPRYAEALGKVMRAIGEEEEQEFGAPVLSASAPPASLPPGRADDEELYDTIRQNQVKALQNIPGAEYTPEAGVASVGRVTPTAAVASYDPEEGVGRTLAWAKAYPLPFPSHKHGGEPIDTRPTEELQGFMDWALKKVREAKAAGQPPRAMLGELAEACELILNDRAKDQLQIDLAGEVTAEGEQGDDPTSGRPSASTPSSPGSDSSPERAPAVAPTDGKSARQLTKEIDILARSGKIPVEEKDAWMTLKLSREGLNPTKLQAQLDRFVAIAAGGDASGSMPAALQDEDDDLPF